MRYQGDAKTAKADAKTAGVAADRQRDRWLTDVVPEVAA
jgi:hypothetical protein